MNRLVKFFDSLAEEEDSATMDAMNKLYGPMLHLSLIFPTWKRANMKFTILFIVIYVLASPLQLLLVLNSLQKLTSHFEMLSLVVLYSIVHVLILVAIVLLNYDRKIVAGMHRLMATDLGNYRGGRIYDEREPQAWEKYMKKELYMFLCVPGAVIVCSALAVTVPYTKTLLSEKFSDDSPYTESGVNMNLPVALYYPFPTHSGILHVAAVLGQLATGTVGAVVIVGLELLIFRVTQAVIYELKVLQHGLRTIFKRALLMYEKTYPDGSTAKLRFSDSKLQECIRLSLNDSIRHHYRIIGIQQQYQFIFKWTIAAAYFFGTGAVGLCLINIMNAYEDDEYENLMVFLTLTIAAILNVLLISILGENLTSESRNLRDTLYDIDWHRLDVKNRRVMLIFQTKITEPTIVKAGGLTNVSLDTFSTIMNSAYSFFNLINAKR